MAQSFMAHKSPVRIGVVFCSPKSADEDPDNPSNSMLIRRIMNYALSEGRTRRAFNDIIEVNLVLQVSNLFNFSVRIVQV